jgi:ketosteroid isomerase-like protein
MKKLFLLLILFTFAGASSLTKGDANAMGLKSRNSVDTISLPAPGLTSPHAELDNQAPVIMNLLKEVLAASNRHDIATVMHYYAPTYISGDHLNLDQVKQMIQETWKLYPDIRYDSKLVSLRVAGDWATVETQDTAHATAMPDGSLSGRYRQEKGTLDSQSRGLLYLKRTGTSWDIVGDQTLYEQAAILYGDVKNLSLLLSAPDSVVAEQAYTAKLHVKVPDNRLVIASISKDPLVYPQRLPQEKFRSLNTDDTVLERVMSANKDSLNEMITVTVGLTEVNQDKDDRPSIKLQGVATLVKRVNVSPRITAMTTMVNGGNLVRRSASGAIDLTRVENLPTVPGGIK